jgi:adenylate cyclase
LHAGDAFCGAVGDETRLEFTVLGDTVNIAARLEQETKAVGLPLVVSRAFLAAAGETVDGRDWQQLGARTSWSAHFERARATSRFVRRAPF